MSYLEWHGNGLRVRVKVSKKALPIIGKQFLKVPLRHDSIARANRDKHQIVHELKRKIEAAEREADRKVGADPLTDEAMGWRAELTKEVETAHKDGEASEGDRAESISLLISDRAEEIEASQGLRKAKEFAAVAFGRATPINALLDDWIESTTRDGKGKAQHRRAVNRYIAWCGRLGVSATIEAANVKIANRFFDDVFPPGSPYATANNNASSLRTFWEWLVRRDEARFNPWKEVRREKVASHRMADDEGKRPFTDDEVQKLLEGGASQRNRDMMLIAALSGMRIDDIARLTAADCQSGTFRIRLGKTAAGRREVPIHSLLGPVVERRLSGKKPEDFLIEELGPEPPPQSERKRSSPASKEFTRYRRRLGIDERPGDKRQSNADFHSFRRWFIAKRVDALAKGALGFSGHTLADVVGHDREVGELAMTFGRYPGPADMEKRRACVEAAALPPEKTMAEKADVRASSPHWSDTSAPGSR